MFWPCHESRHAQCIRKGALGHVCLCPAGQCASADGACRQGNYRQIAQGVEIKNVKWPSQTVYFPRSIFLHGVGVDSSADGNGYDDKFDFFQLPGHDGNGGNQVALFITSTQQPDFVAVGSKPGSLVDTLVMKSLRRYYLDLSLASTVLCKQGKNYQFGIFSVSLQSWWYISKVAINGNVNTWAYSQPGPEGQWTIDPPLDDDSMLHACG